MSKILEAIRDLHSMPLSKHEARLEEFRNAIIEECAKVADTFDHTKPGAFDPWTSEQIASAIRALKSPENDVDAQEFVPCALELEDAGITEMVLKDCLMIWEPWGNEGVEFGYDADGDLQAIRIPALVAGHKALRERDRNPKGGDGEAGSVEDESPVPEGNSPNESPETDAGEATQ